jgi:hypothetical protein
MDYQDRIAQHRVSPAQHRDAPDVFLYKRTIAPLQRLGWRIAEVPQSTGETHQA